MRTAVTTSICLLVYGAMGYGFAPAGGPKPQTSGAAMWQLVSRVPSSGRPYQHLAIGPDGAIYACGNAGVTRSRDGGKTWMDMTGALPLDRVNALAFNAAGEPVAGLRGARSNAYRYTGGQWRLAAGLEANYMVSEFTLDRSRNLVAVTGWSGDVYRSMDNGGSYTRIASSVGPTYGHSTGALWVVGSAPDGTLYTGGEPAAGIFRSRDGGSTWEPIGLSTSEGYGGNVGALTFSSTGRPVVGRFCQTSGEPVQVFTARGWAKASGLPSYTYVRSIGRFGRDGLLSTFLEGERTHPHLVAYTSADGGLHWSRVPYDFPPGTLSLQDALATDSQGRLYMLTLVNRSPAVNSLYRYTP